MTLLTFLFCNLFKHPFFQVTIDIKTVVSISELLDAYVQLIDLESHPSKMPLSNMFLYCKLTAMSIKALSNLLTQDGALEHILKCGVLLSS